MLSSRPLSVHGDARARHAPLAKTPGRTGAKARALRENWFAEPQRLLKDSKPAIATTTAHAPARPLGDKTPLPNRIANAAFFTPLQRTSKLSKLALLNPEGEGEGDIGALLRPSSTRKHIRLPRSGSRSFETPPNNWDISDGDVSVGLPEPQVQGVGDDVECVAEDYDEIEYMPPSMIDLPYAPPFDFDLPDYKALGKALLSLTRSYPPDDADSPLSDYEYDNPALPDPLASWDLLTMLPPPPPPQTTATQRKPAPAPGPRLAQLPRAPSTASTAPKPGPRAPSRPTTAASRTATASAATSTTPRRPLVGTGAPRVGGGVRVGGGGGAGAGTGGAGAGVVAAGARAASASAMGSRPGARAAGVGGAQSDGIRSATAGARTLTAGPSARTTAGGTTAGAGARKPLRVVGAVKTGSVKIRGTSGANKAAAGSRGLPAVAGSGPGRAVRELDEVARELGLGRGGDGGLEDDFRFDV